MHYCGREDRENVRARGWHQGNCLGDTAGKLHIWTHSIYNSMHETCARQSLNTSQHGKGSSSPSPSHGTIDSCQLYRCNDRVSLRMKLLINWLCPSGRPHVQEYLGSTNWLLWETKSTPSWLGRECSRSGKSWTKKGEYDQNMYKILREQIKKKTLLP